MVYYVETGSWGVFISRKVLGLLQVYVFLSSSLLIHHMVNVLNMYGYNIFENNNCHVMRSLFILHFVNFPQLTLITGHSLSK